MGTSDAYITRTGSRLDGTDSDPTTQAIDGNGILWYFTSRKEVAQFLPASRSLLTIIKILVKCLPQNLLCALI
jgi:hypothetical protein